MLVGTFLNHYPRYSSFHSVLLTSCSSLCFFMSHNLCIPSQSCDYLSILNSSGQGPFQCTRSLQYELLDLRHHVLMMFSSVFYQLPQAIMRGTVYFRNAVEIQLGTHQDKPILVHHYDETGLTRTCQRFGSDN